MIFIVITIKLHEILYEKQRQNGDARPISLRDLADRVGVHRESLRRFAANEMERVPLDLVAKLCVYLNCKVGDLLVLEDEH